MVVEPPQPGHPWLSNHRRDNSREIAASKARELRLSARCARPLRGAQRGGGHLDPSHVKIRSVAIEPPSRRARSRSRDYGAPGASPDAPGPPQPFERRPGLHGTGGQAHDADGRAHDRGGARGEDDQRECVAQAPEARPEADPRKEPSLAVYDSRDSGVD